MGGGSAVKQHERRFLQGEREDTGKKKECGEAYWSVKTFGEYEVRETKGGEYGLFKKGNLVGMFVKATVEEERILFLLSRGFMLEVSGRGVREITIPEKALLMGMVAADGSNRSRREPRRRGGYRTDYLTAFYSDDLELIRMFDESANRVYNLASHHYVRKRNGLITAAIYSKGIYYDLSDLNLKPGPYEFHAPREHLDDEGKRAFLKGFFSGDGNVSVSGGEITIRFYSRCREGLEELRQTLMDLGFHPRGIREDREPKGKSTYSFLIPRSEHIKFINEIGSYRPKHVRIFEEMKRRGEGREE
jgi:hypothetical protein